MISLVAVITCILGKASLQVGAKIALLCYQSRPKRLIRVLYDFAQVSRAGGKILWQRHIKGRLTLRRDLFVTDFLFF